MGRRPLEYLTRELSKSLGLRNKRNLHRRLKTILISPQAYDAHVQELERFATFKKNREAQESWQFQ